MAPAGGFDSVIAAVRAGADAVYLGEKYFSARASAKNFDSAELKEAVAYCHIHGVKVYVTINTVIFDDEYEELKSAIVEAAKADADALIVQSMGVASLAKQIAPDLALHASTQMSVHTASGVRALYELGFKRVVLAREMSREEIKDAAKVPVELEVFVHGALCMSVSGQCYFSAMLGSRSGNRGACAQTCRLPFRVGKEKSGYALSLRDNSLMAQIEDLQSIGVASAKIEGRMKRPEYVAAAVRACREQRDLGFITDDAAKELRAVFARTGFTDGYYSGKTGAEMFGTRTKDDVISADSALLGAIRQHYKDEVQHIPLSGRFTAAVGQKAEYTVSDGSHTVTVKSDAQCEEARNAPLDRERCRVQLGKTGGTAYLMNEIDITADGRAALPVSVLNSLRRQALKALDRERSVVHNYKINDVKIDLGTPFRSNKKSAVRARVTGTKIGAGFRDIDMVFVPLFSDLGELERLRSEGFPVGVEIPRGMFGMDKQISARLERVRELGITDALCGNIGALYLAKERGMTLHGDFGLNLSSTYDLLWAEEYGLSDAVLSFELTFERIKKLGGRLERGIISYGYLPLMLCRNCPNKSAGISCKTCKNQSKMQDRKNKSFFLRCSNKVVEILNCVPVYTAEREISDCGVSFNILRFSVENYVENVEKPADLHDFSMLKDKFTHGLYLRGVE